MIQPQPIWMFGNSIGTEHDRVGNLALWSLDTEPDRTYLTYILGKSMEAAERVTHLLHGHLRPDYLRVSPEFKYFSPRLLPVHVGINVPSWQFARYLPHLADMARPWSFRYDASLFYGALRHNPTCTFGFETTTDAVMFKLRAA